MTDHDHEEPLDRLRASDPAAEAPAVDRARVRAAVDARLAGDHSAGGAPADQLAARRGRRWPQYAAAAAVALLIGVGGYSLGASGAGGTGMAAEDAAVGDGASSEMAEQDSATSDMAAPGPGSSEEADSASELSIGPYSPRTVFTASGLSTQAGSAPVYGLDASGVATAERARQIAEALGLEPDPVEEDGAWSIGSYDTGEPVLRLYADGTVEYSDPARDPWRCGEATVRDDADDVDDAPGTEEGGIEPASPACADPQGEAPAPDEAEAMFAEMLTSLGVDPADYAVTADRGTEGPVAYVNADLLVEGEPTGVTLGGGVTPDGVTHVWGSLAVPYDLGSYDVVSAQEAVERLMDPRFGGSSSDVMPYALEDAPVEGPPPASEPESIEPGASIPWPVRQVTITGAELGLQSLYTDSGQVLLVPTYTLTGSDAGGDAGTWTVMAVAENGLDLG
ncbi:hypothetical protein IM660_03530 [Ruania alkalisoli]|uniref:Uncharacterized protein n=1 Tax=Ruania alkalisoli TaxID=2779775 RepID=A0A7M1SXC1_9MICO|nr:hypothetical protein [Ruania alkalisoli]QOR71382.1 hypothetical protein IM660_03530 [Ruania alkalisoli]